MVGRGCKERRCYRLRSTQRPSLPFDNANDISDHQKLGRCGRCTPGHLSQGFIHLNRFECRSSFFSWVTRIAINASLATLRKKRASKDISIDACDNDGASGDRWEMPDLREDPERCYSRREREDSLRRAIRRLRPSLRTAMELQGQEQSIREIADSLGISPAAAKSRVSRARLSLRALLCNDSLPSYQSENARSID